MHLHRLVVHFVFFVIRRTRRLLFLWFRWLVLAKTVSSVCAASLSVSYDPECDRSRVSRMERLYPPSPPHSPHDALALSLSHLPFPLMAFFHSFLPLRSFHLNRRHLLVTVTKPLTPLYTSLPELLFWSRNVLVRVEMTTAASLSRCIVVIRRPPCHTPPLSTRPEPCPPRNGPRGVRWIGHSKINCWLRPRKIGLIYGPENAVC
ncbi:hypothetical protein J6590_020843 [Homalodisca vitripennis]|nr:hypothetical protein J6590_020843 [Homalodisca vitripennis]